MKENHRLTIRMIILLIGFALVAGCALPAPAGGNNRSDLIRERDIDTMLSLSESEVTGFFQEYREEFQTLADFLFTNQNAIRESPVVLARGSADNLSKLEDAGMSELANILMDRGPIQSVAAQNDWSYLETDPLVQPLEKYAIFLVDRQDYVFEQSIRYVSDPARVEAEEALLLGMPWFNRTLLFTPLGGGWYYSLAVTQEVKDADRYREAAWTSLTPGRREYLDRTLDWKQAPVFLTGDDSLADGLVVGVLFYDPRNPVSGPSVPFLDPVTCEVVGAGCQGWD